LRRRLSHVKVRVTQATLSRDMSELKLVKTSEGYKPLTNGEEASTLCRARPRPAGISGGPAPGVQPAGAEDSASGAHRSPRR